jgi:hypothetical protein
MMMSRRVANPLRTMARVGPGMRGGPPERLLRHEVLLRSPRVVGPSRQDESPSDGLCSASEQGSCVPQEWRRSVAMASSRSNSIWQRQVASSDGMDARDSRHDVGSARSCCRPRSDVDSDGVPLRCGSFLPGFKGVGGGLSTRPSVPGGWAEHQRQADARARAGRSTRSREGPIRSERQRLRTQLSRTDGLRRPRR